MTEAPTRLADEVATAIRHLIVSEGIALGARLPSERVLAERLGASRPVVSQALRTLSLVGLVDIRRGSGAFVVRSPERGVTSSVDLMLAMGDSLADLMELRLWLETLGVTQAAVAGPPASFQSAEILGALARLEAAAGDPPAWMAADTAFHSAVVAAAGNAYLAAMFESVHTAVLRHQFSQWIEEDDLPEWLLQTDAAEQRALHAPIATAVIAGRSRSAVAAVSAHHAAMLVHLGIA